MQMQWKTLVKFCLEKLHFIFLIIVGYIFQTKLLVLMKPSCYVT